MLMTLTDILGKEVPLKIQNLAIRRPFLGRVLFHLQLYKYENEHFKDFLENDVEYHLSIAKEFKDMYPTDNDLKLSSALNDELVNIYFYLKQKYQTIYCPNCLFENVNKAHKHTYFFKRLEIDKAFEINNAFNMNDIL